MSFQNYVQSCKLVLLTFWSDFTVVGGPLVSSYGCANLWRYWKCFPLLGSTGYHVTTWVMKAASEEVLAEFEVWSVC